MEIDFVIMFVHIYTARSIWLYFNTSLTPTNTFLIWKTNKQAQINQMSANNVQYSGLKNCSNICMSFTKVDNP